MIFSWLIVMLTSNIVQKKMQIAVNSIQCWAHQNGCKFSSSKTKMVHFHNKKGIYLSPKINLYNKKIESVKSHKFLGLMFDEKLTWQPHMAMLVNSSRLVSNLIKSLTSYKWGASQTTLLHLFRIMLRSKWDYGCEVYNSATPSILKQLDIYYAQRQPTYNIRRFQNITNSIIAGYSKRDVLGKKAHSNVS